MTTQSRSRLWPAWMLPVFVYSLAVFAVVGFVGALSRFGMQPVADRWVGYLMLAAVLCFTEMKPIVVARAGGVDDIVASTTFAMALLLAFGPAPAMLAQAVATILADTRARKPFIKATFNLAQYWVSLAAAAAVFDAVHADRLPFVDRHPSPNWSVSVLAASVTYFVVNNSMVGIVRGLHEHQPIGRSVIGSFLSEWSSDVVLLALAPIVVIVANLSLVGVPVLLLPVLSVYRTATMSAEKEHLALHDSLTDLPNRFNFLSTLGRHLERSGGAHPAAVLLIDLDRFKEVNDTLGHQAGDELLRMVGPRIVAALPTEGFVARLGGDEFAVLIPDLASEAEAIAIGRRIAQSLDSPFRLAGFNIEIEASIGVAFHPAHGFTDEILLKRADIAMYAAKAAGTTVEQYNAKLDQNSRQRLELVGQLRGALLAGDVVLHYQPKLELASGQVHDVEGLVRWMHPEFGMLTPVDFVPMAEHTGLVRQLTSHVLDIAAAQAARWRDEGRPLTVAVNLSARSLHDGAIVQEVIHALERYSLAPRLLRLEITESSIMKDPVRARRTLAQLNDMGIQLSIDDFGTGYSSLAYLQDLSANEIKIDRSFVSDVVRRGGAQVIVRSTIDLARSLGYTSVAEGVETAEDLAWLVQAGCTKAQGYHITPPLAAEQFDAWLRTHRGEPAEAGTVVPLPSHRGADR